MVWVRRSRSENCSGPMRSAAKPASPCSSSHHLNGSICAHSPSLLSIRKLSSRPQFSFGAATLVPATLLSQLLQGAANNYDVDREGRLLTPVETIAGESRPTVLVVLNWNEELKQRVPAR